MSKSLRAVNESVCRAHNTRKFKIGHCRFQTRPLGVETGHYRKNGKRPPTEAALLYRPLWLALQLDSLFNRCACIEDREGTAGRSAGLYSLARYFEGPFPARRACGLDDLVLHTLMLHEKITNGEFPWLQLLIQIRTLRNTT
jgi:hypothetical protein